MALRILNQNNLSLVKTVGNTAPICRRFRCRCMSTSQTVTASAGKAEDSEESCREIVELQRRLFIRPLTRRRVDELQPRNLPEYGQQQQWSTEEQLRYKHGNAELYEPTPYRVPMLPIREYTGQEERRAIPSSSTRAYSTYAQRFSTLISPTGLHPERPLSLSYRKLVDFQERCFSGNAYNIGRGLNCVRLNGLRRENSGNLLNYEQTRLSHQEHQDQDHKSSRKKTTKRILEEWNRRSSQDYLRIDNILYRYKRKELQKKGLLIEDCPKDKKKQKSGKKQQPHGKKTRKNKKKEKGPACRNKKLRIKCAAVEPSTQCRIDAALDELVGVAPTLPSSLRQQNKDNSSRLTRKDALKYIHDKNHRDNKALECLMNTTPACFNTPQTNASVVTGGVRPFMTATVPEAPMIEQPLHQQSKPALDTVSEFDIDDECETRLGERADDGLDITGLKPLPTFIPMKLPAEAMMPPPSLVEAAPLPRLRKRDILYDEV